MKLPKQEEYIFEEGAGKKVIKGKVCYPAHMHVHLTDYMVGDLAEQLVKKMRNKKQWVGDYIITLSGQITKLPEDK